MLQETPAKLKQAGADTPLFSAANTNEVRRIKNWLETRIRQASKLSANEFNSETVTITPAMAEHILQNHNIDNRPVRSSRVYEFVKMINEGRWKLTSQGISFSRNGYLNNGQHRLQAIVRAGRPVALYVTFGEDRDVFDVLDTGSARGGSDTLHIRGYKNVTNLAAAARLLNNLLSGKHLSNSKICNDEVLNLLERHPELNDASGAGLRVGTRFKASSAAMTLAFYLIDTQSENRDLLPDFITRLADGGVAPKTPLAALRDGLMQKTIDAGYRTANERAYAQAAAVIKAWNLTRRGLKRGTVIWTVGEPFPTVE